VSQGPLEQFDGPFRLVGGDVGAAEVAVQVGTRLGRQVARADGEPKVADRLGCVAAPVSEQAEARVGAGAQHGRVAALALLAETPDPLPNRLLRVSHLAGRMLSGEHTCVNPLDCRAASGKGVPSPATAERG